MTSSFNAINKNKSFELDLTSFLPGGKWTPCDEKGKFIDSNRAMWTKDSLSGAIYLNQPTDHLRFKLSFLTGFLAGIIGGNAISLTINAAYRTLKVTSLSHFWLPISCINQNKDDKSFHLRTRCAEVAKDISRIVTTPFAWLGLFFASWAGAFDPRENGPRDGAKIFASIEIAMYGGTMGEGHFGWAPCYQPNAIIHGLGGDINRERAF
ncbi:MAG: hypothetical protein H0X29_00215 [Parachlamydiaceae bacterium]|nr:hypothetical protein [Parachlamydiaceae bacterium]